MNVALSVDKEDLFRDCRESMNDNECTAIDRKESKSSQVLKERLGRFKRHAAACAFQRNETAETRSMAGEAVQT